MKYRFKKIKVIAENTVRVKEKFLILPLIIDNELRWLEKVKIIQVYTKKTKLHECDPNDIGAGTYDIFYKWVNTAWYDGKHALILESEKYVKELS